MTETELDADVGFEAGEPAHHLPPWDVRSYMLHNPWEGVLTLLEVEKCLIEATQQVESELLEMEVKGKLDGRNSFIMLMVAPPIPGRDEPTSIDTRTFAVLVAVREDASKNDMLVVNAAAKLSLLDQHPTYESLTQLLKECPEVLTTGTFTWPGAWRSGALMAGGSGFKAEDDEHLAMWWVVMFRNRLSGAITCVVVARHQPDLPAEDKLGFVGDTPDALLQYLRVLARKVRPAPL